MYETDPNLLQCYILLTTDELKAINELFDANDREKIAAAVKTMIEVYIKEHSREDRVKMDSDKAWDKLKDMMNNK